jgi:hypothetical protein
LALRLEAAHDRRSQTQAKCIGKVIKLIIGTSFIVIGIEVLVVTVIRRRASGLRAVFSPGVWSAIYGIQRLNDCSFLIKLLPHWMQLCIPCSHALILGYIAMQQVFANDCRQLSIENELAVVRELQFSIIPTTTPEVRRLRIAAVYEPMTSVAGDFYEFPPVDEYRAGFLVSDAPARAFPPH